MIITVPVGVTRTLGKQQGYKGLPIKDVIIDGTPFMLSVWEPSPEEIQRIKAGAKIILSVLGTQHPPVKVDVGEPAA